MKNGPRCKRLSPLWQRPCCAKRRSRQSGQPRLSGQHANISAQNGRATMSEHSQEILPTSALRTDDVQRTCYRCGKPEEEQRPLRLLPGSTHSIVCPECYLFLWGWKEQKGAP